MTNYTKSTNFTSKDSLASGNPLKIVKGTEIDAEFNNISIAVATKADLLSPTFTGTPVAPTAASGTSTTQLATTAFVTAADVLKAPLISPTFTGTPTAPTAAYGTNNTQLATTAFITAALQVIYPVGSIYTNASVSTNPSTLFGFGTWVAFGGGRVPVGITAGDASFDALEETGGSKDAVLPSHTHTVSSSGTTAGANADHTHFVSGNSGFQSNDHAHIATSTVNDPSHSHVLSNNPDAVEAAGGNSNGGYTGGQNLTTISATNSATTGITVSTSISGVTSNHTHAFSSTTGTTSATHAHDVTVSGTTAASGVSATNANLQPYVVVAMWKRTA